MVGQEDDGIARAAVVQHAYRCSDRRDEFLLVELALLAKADQKYPVCQHAGNAMKHEGRAVPAVKVAVAEDRGEVPG